MMKRELAKLLDDARSKGWTVDRTKSGHHCLRHPAGGLVYTGSTPGCWRALLNARAAIRRAERTTTTETEQ